MTTQKQIDDACAVQRPHEDWRREADWAIALVAFSTTVALGGLAFLLVDFFMGRP